MKNFIDLLLNDSVLFLIAITIIVLIVLIIICIILLKKRYDLDSNEQVTDTTTNALNELSELTQTDNHNQSKIESTTFLSKEEPVEKEYNRNDSKIDLEAMLSQMEATINEKDKAIANFEQEQEEKAIISYEELKKAVNQNSNTEVTKVETLEPKNEFKKDTRVVDTSNDNKSFKNTDFISPIFGKMDNNYDYPKISEFEEQPQVTKRETNNDLMYAKHSEDKNEAFLDSLKQFRKNLE